MLGGDSFGKMLMYFGILLIVVGAVLHFGGKFLSLGKLPGDICIEKENFSFYFPIATSVLISLVLTLILNIFSRR